MTSLPGDWLGLTALVFLLGLRHGCDPDHLVAIDGLTRSNRSRWCGLFFSLGHGVVVTLVGLVVAVTATHWEAPPWLHETGAWISISVLLVLGLANLMMVFRTPAERSVPLVGLRSRWFADQLTRTSHPVFIASIGAAFALSFDTLSHALVFSLTGATMAGWLFATLLGLVFTLGMVLTDALNGWWVARMIRSADRRSMLASRVMSIAISFLCLTIAAGALAEHSLPRPAMSIAAVVVVLAAYLLACRSIYRDGDSRYGTAQKQQAGPGSPLIGR
jgi:nickel/cobalt transporter (NiCoT) family protein